MLDDIGKCEQAAFFTDYAPQILRDALGDIGPTTGKPIDLLEEFVSALVVIDFVKDLLVGSLAETESAFGDVLAVVVVDGCCADSFILWMLI